MKLKKLASATALSAAAVLTAATPAFAGTSGSPDPVVPGEVISLAPDDKTCASYWQQLIDASANDPIYGALEVTWPDGTTQVVNPLTNPLDIAVPAGMTPGTATIKVYKGLVDGSPEGHYEPCDGSFVIAEDATVPIVDPASLVVLAGGGGLVLAMGSKLRRRA